MGIRIKMINCDFFVTFDIRTPSRWRMPIQFLEKKRFSRKREIVTFLLLSLWVQIVLWKGAHFLFFFLDSRTSNWICSQNKWILLAKFYWVLGITTWNEFFLGTLILLRIPQRANIALCSRIRKHITSDGSHRRVLSSERYNSDPSVTFSAEQQFGCQCVVWKSTPKISPELFNKIDYWKNFSLLCTTFFSVSLRTLLPKAIGQRTFFLHFLVSLLPLEQSHFAHKACFSRSCL